MAMVSKVYLLMYNGALTAGYVCMWNGTVCMCMHVELSMWNGTVCMCMHVEWHCVHVHACGIVHVE